MQLILPGKNPAISLNNATPDTVYRVAFSPDGKSLASDGDGLLIWNVSDGTFTNRRAENCLFALAFSPNGKLLATHSGGNEIEVMDTVNDGTAPIILKGHTELIFDVAFSPDGQTLASASWDKTVRLWRVSDGSLLRTLEGHIDNVNSVAFSSDGQLLASGSGDNTIRIWQVSDGTLINIITTTFSVQSVAISRVEPILVSGGGDGTTLWNLNDGTKIKTLDTGYSLSVAFSPDGQKLASGTIDNKVLVWQISDSTLLNTLEGHTNTVYSVTFSPDGTLLASGSNDGTIRLWNVVSSIPTSSPIPTITAIPTVLTSQPFNVFQIVRYSQQDPQWKNIQYGSGPNTIGNIGSPLTSLAMYVSGWGFTETPETLNTKLTDVGVDGFIDSSIVWSAITKIYPNIVSTGITVSTDSDAPLGEIDASISAGQPVLVEVDSSPDAGLQAHWVVLYAKQGSDYLILDPWPYPPDTQDVTLMSRYSQGNPIQRAIKAVAWFQYFQP